MLANSQGNLSQVEADYKSAEYAAQAAHDRANANGE